MSVMGQRAGLTAGSRQAGSSSVAALRPRALPSRAHQRQRGCTTAAAAAAAPTAEEVGRATAVVREACATKKVEPPSVVSALELIEAAHQSSSQVAADFPAALDGTWRLVFAVPAPISAWAYIPVHEDAEISVGNGTIDLVSYIGPLSFRFAGQARFEGGAPGTAGAKAEMHFSFKRMTMEVFGFKRESELSGKPKVYSFFLLGGGLAAANSSGTGGKTLMYRA